MYVSLFLLSDCRNPSRGGKRRKESLHQKKKPMIFSFFSGHAHRRRFICARSRCCTPHSHSTPQLLLMLLPPPQMPGRTDGRSRRHLPVVFCLLLTPSFRHRRRFWSSLSLSLSLSSFCLPGGKGGKTMAKKLWRRRRRLLRRRSRRRRKTRVGELPSASSSHSSGCLQR